MEDDEPKAVGPEGIAPEQRWAYLRGVEYGFAIGREQGFGEGVKAMHRVIVKILRNQHKQNGGV